MTKKQVTNFVNMTAAIYTAATIIVFRHLLSE